MKTRSRTPFLLTAAVLLLAAGLAFWPAPAGGSHPGRSVRAAPSALTPGQNAAIQGANLLLLNNTDLHLVYLPRINR